MKTSLEERIRVSDTDSQSEVKFASIIDLIQDCMNLQSESVGESVDYQIQTKKAWILSSWQLDFCGELKYGDKVEVTTWPYLFKGACGKRNAVIRLEGSDEPVVMVNSIWALYDMEKESLCKLSKQDIAKYSCEEPLEMDYRKGKINRLKQYQEYPSYVVRNYHLDFNRHMNNGWYIRLAEEFLTTRKYIKRMSVEYKKQAKLGDIIIPYVGEDEKGRMVVELRNTQQELYAVIEFRENDQ